MLVLSRKEGEVIVIDGEIRIHVCAIEGNTVKLGIDAPRHLSVNRQEVQERVAPGKDD